MIKCADFFCGGGGISTGMIEAFKKAGVDYSLIGINHWQVAIDTNKLNHKGDYYCVSIEGVEPTDVVKDRFGLVEGQLFKMPNGETYKLDITYRMLQPHELAAAMSFPKDYKFCGNKTEQIRQIGNAVCPKLSESLISAAISA